MSIIDSDTRLEGSSILVILIRWKNLGEFIENSIAKGMHCGDSAIYFVLNMKEESKHLTISLLKYSMTFSFSFARLPAEWYHPKKICSLSCYSNHHIAHYSIVFKSVIVDLSFENGELGVAISNLSFVSQIALIFNETDFEIDLAIWHLINSFVMSS